MAVARWRARESLIDIQREPRRHDSGFLYRRRRNNSDYYFKIGVYWQKLPTIFTNERLSNCGICLRLILQIISLLDSFRYYAGQAKTLIDNIEIIYWIECVFLQCIRKNFYCTLNTKKQFTNEIIINYRSRAISARQPSQAKDAKSSQSPVQQIVSTCNTIPSEPK